MAIEAQTARWTHFLDGTFASCKIVKASAGKQAELRRDDSTRNASETSLCILPAAWPHGSSPILGEACSPIATCSLPHGYSLTVSAAHTAGDRPCPVGSRLLREVDSAAAHLETCVEDSQALDAEVGGIYRLLLLALIMRFVCCAARSSVTLDT